MSHNNKQFIIHHISLLGLSTYRFLFSKFFLIEPQIGLFHVKLGYLKPTRILSHLKINYFLAKLMNLILTYLETWQTSFWNFTQIVSLRAYRLKKSKRFSSNFFCWQFHAGKVVRLGLRNFSLKQTKVMLISWRFYAQCRQALKRRKNKSNMYIKFKLSLSPAFCQF